MLQRAIAGVKERVRDLQRAAMRCQRGAAIESVNGLGGRIAGQPTDPLPSDAADAKISTSAKSSAARMSKHTSSVVRIASPQGSAALSKGQKTFNRLIQKIEEQRKLLQSWQDSLPRFRAKQAGEFEPVLSHYNETRETLVRLLDTAYDAHGLTKTERAKLRDLIASIVGELLAHGTKPELVALYDKHSDLGFAEEEQMAADSTRALIKSVLGVDLGDDAELDSPEDMLARLQQKLLEQADSRSAQAPKRSQRKPSAKTLAREAKQQEEAQAASQSIREVYRKLASSLHPDRETDTQERARKTTLMQRANAAYEKSDLLGLLQLQLEAEQIDHADIGALSESRLKHYNQVLTEQLAELEEEIRCIETSFDGHDPFSRRRAHPALVLQWLDRDIAELKAATRNLQRDLRELGDIKRLKAKLRHYRIEPDPPFAGDPFDPRDL